jgi:hypothetical protein
VRYARCECLDYLIVFSEANLHLSAYVTYYDRALFIAGVTSPFESDVLISVWPPSRLPYR